MEEKVHENRYRLYNLSIYVKAQNSKSSAPLCLSHFYTADAFLFLLSPIPNYPIPNYPREKENTTMEDHTGSH